MTRVWSYQNFTTIAVNAMKRVSKLKNGEILYFSNMISKDDNLKIGCKAHEKVTDEVYSGMKYLINIRNVSRIAKPKVPEIYENNKKRQLDISATIGQMMLLECAASGVPTPSIQWRFVNQYGVEGMILNLTPRLATRPLRGHMALKSHL